MANQNNKRNYKNRKSTKNNKDVRDDMKRNSSGKEVNTANFAEKAVAGGQDPEWYLRNPNLINSVTSIPYLTQYGNACAIEGIWNC